MYIFPIADHVKSDNVVNTGQLVIVPFVINIYLVGRDTKTRLIASYFPAFGVGYLSLPLTPLCSPFLIS